MRLFQTCSGCPCPLRPRCPPHSLASDLRAPHPAPSHLPTPLPMPWPFSSALRRHHGGRAGPHRPTARRRCQHEALLPPKLPSTCRAAPSPLPTPFPTPQLPRLTSRRRQQRAFLGTINCERSLACVGSAKRRHRCRERVFVQLPAGLAGRLGRRGCRCAGRRRLPSR